MPTGGAKNSNTTPHTNKRSSGSVAGKDTFRNHLHQAYDTTDAPNRQRNPLEPSNPRPYEIGPTQHA